MQQVSMTTAEAVRKLRSVTLFNGNSRQKKTGVSKYFQYLETDPNLRRWHDNLKRGSAYTADIYLRRLCAFCQKRNTTPGQFARLSLDKIEDLAQDYVNELEESILDDGKHYAPLYVSSNLKAIKSWTEWNRKKITRKIKIRDETRTPTLEGEEVPSKNELERVLYAPTTNSRTRASIAIIAFSGCRLEVQGNRNGNDGLRIDDLSDLRVIQEDGKQKGIVFERIPSRVVVRASLSKTRKQYFTYLPEEGCEILKQHLLERIASGEELSSASPVISLESYGRRKIKSLYNIEDKSSFLATGTVSKHIRKAMRAVGLKQRPYVWRSYFDTRLMHAESEKLVTHSYAQFWMGHKGDIERTYTLNKQKLPDDVMDGIWQAAKRVQGIVQSRTPEEDIVTIEEARVIGKETWFLSLGFSREDIRKLDLIHKEGEELQRVIKSKLQSLLSEKGRRQKIIDVKEIDKAIEEGYEYVDKLPDGRIIVKLAELNLQ